MQNVKLKVFQIYSVDLCNATTTINHDIDNVCILYIKYGLWTTYGDCMSESENISRVVLYRRPTAAGQVSGDPLQCIGTTCCLFWSFFNSYRSERVSDQDVWRLISSSWRQLITFLFLSAHPVTLLLFFSQRSKGVISTKVPRNCLHINGRRDQMIWSGSLTDSFFALKAASRR